MEKQKSIDSFIILIMFLIASFASLGSLFFSEIMEFVSL